MPVEDDFRRVLRRETEDMRDDSTLLPSALAMAAVEALPTVDGASLSVLSADLRIPLGANNADSAVAEAAETTLGDGPCLDAIKEDRVISAPADELRRRWPLLARTWVFHTPYRSALSVPVPLSRDVGCALNLYFIGDEDDAGPGGGSSGIHQSAATVGSLIALELLASFPKPAADADEHDQVSDWLRTPAALRRQQSWVAIGKVMQAASLTAEDALDLLRGRAYVLDRSLDDLVAEVVDSDDLPTLLAL